MTEMKPNKVREEQLTGLTGRDVQPVDTQPLTVKNAHRAAMIRKKGSTAPCFLPLQEKAPWHGKLRASFRFPRRRKRAATGRVQGLGSDGVQAPRLSRRLVGAGLRCLQMEFFRSGHPGRIGHHNLRKGTSR